MPVQRFEDLDAWKRARELAIAIYSLSSTGDWRREPGLHDQVRRAAVSVMSNIAEGFERYGRGEMRHFLSIARGSAAEVRSQLYLARDLGYVGPSDFEQARELALRVSKVLAALHSSVPRKAAR